MAVNPLPEIVSTMTKMTTKNILANSNFNFWEGLISSAMREGVKGAGYGAAIGGGAALLQGDSVWEGVKSGAVRGGLLGTAYGTAATLNDSLISTYGTEMTGAGAKDYDTTNLIKNIKKNATTTKDLREAASITAATKRRDEAFGQIRRAAKTMPKLTDTGINKTTSYISEQLNKGVWSYRDPEARKQALEHGQNIIRNALSGTNVEEETLNQLIKDVSSGVRRG